MQLNVQHQAATQYPFLTPLLNMVWLQKDVGGSCLSHYMIWGVAIRFPRHIQMTKLVQLDANICPYLMALMIAALKHQNKTLSILKSLKLDIVSDVDWENRIMLDASKYNEKWSIIGLQLASRAITPEN